MCPARPLYHRHRSIRAYGRVRRVDPRRLRHLHNRQRRRDSRACPAQCPTAQRNIAGFDLARFAPLWDFCAGDGRTIRYLDPLNPNRRCSLCWRPMTRLMHCSRSTRPAEGRTSVDKNARNPDASGISSASARIFHRPGVDAQSRASSRSADIRHSQPPPPVPGTRFIRRCRGRAGLAYDLPVARNDIYSAPTSFIRVGYGLIGVPFHHCFSGPRRKNARWR